MNGLLLLAIAAIILVLAYLLYGRYLVRTWGIDENAKTPAVEKEDGVDYVPSNKWEVFTHQFSSIAGAGPVTGPVMALVGDGCQQFYGFLLVVFSLELFKILGLYMPLLSRMENQ